MEQIDEWTSTHRTCDSQMKDLLPLLDQYINEQGDKDDQIFIYFAGALRDWTGYEMSYIAIRSANWKMRNAGK